MSSIPHALLLAAALAGLAAGGCGPESQPSSSPSAPEPGASVSTDEQAATRLLSATVSGFTEPAEWVLRDADRFGEAWRTVHQGVPGASAPTVDFGDRMVVLLALGERSTGGFSVRFDELVRKGSGAVVRYTVTTPGPGCMTTQMLTAPVDVVSVPSVDGEVRFDRRTVVQDC